MKLKYVLVLAISIDPVLCLAQSTDDTATGTGHEKLASRIQQRFAAADKNGDVKLSKSEAQAGMPRVAKRFDTIDAGAKGYITMEDLRSFLAQRRPGSAI